MTEEEKFLIALYKRLKITDEEILDVNLVGRSLGFKEKKIRTITKCLHLSNFIKKEDDSKVYLTSNAFSLVDKLLNS